MSEKTFRQFIKICRWGEHLNRLKIRIPDQSRLHITVRRAFSSQRDPNSSNPYVANCRRGVKTIPSLVSKSPGHSRNVHTIEAKFVKDLGDIESECTQILSHDNNPSEKDVENLFGKCNNVAKSIVVDATNSTKSNTGATSALLALDIEQSDQDIHQTSVEVARTLQSLSSLAHTVIKHPKIFISPTILKMYVDLQATLGRAETLPEAFHLYSHKPIPLKDSSPIRYSNPELNIFINAIPSDVTEKALEVAIKAKQLVIAIDIIEMAHTGRAVLASKLIRKALLPASIVTITPFATYSLASQLSYWQTSMDTTLATNVAFLGIMAYISLTGTVGLIAIFTSNDQMDRVTWAPGVPLFQRWMREDERAAIDKVASAWGFSESWRRGEEEGEEWELIKEWVSRRAMILDRVELMEGMD